MRIYRVQFLPVDGRGPYFMGIVASSKEEALPIAASKATSEDDGIFFSPDPLTTSEIADMLLNCSDQEAFELFGEYSIPYMEEAISMVSNDERKGVLYELYYTWHHEPEHDETMED